MKRLSLLISLFLLTGCLEKPVPVTIKFPAVPKELLEACPDLKNVNPTTEKLSEVLPIIVDNYSQYYQCKIKVDDWIEWYNANSKIYKDLK
jgi:hypothetical protein